MASNLRQNGFRERFEIGSRSASLYETLLDPASEASSTSTRPFGIQRLVSHEQYFSSFRVLGKISEELWPLQRSYRARDQRRNQFLTNSLIVVLT